MSELIHSYRFERFFFDVVVVVNRLDIDAVRSFLFFTCQYLLSAYLPVKLFKRPTFRKLVIDTLRG